MTARDMKGGVRYIQGRMSRRRRGKTRGAKTI